MARAKSTGENVVDASQCGERDLYIEKKGPAVPVMRVGRTCRVRSEYVRIASGSE